MFCASEFLLKEHNENWYFGFCGTLWDFLWCDFLWVVSISRILWLRQPIKCQTSWSVPWLLNLEAPWGVSFLKYVLTSQPSKNVFYIVWMCNINAIHTCYIRHVAIFIWPTSVSCISSLFPMALWPYVFAHCIAGKYRYAYLDTACDSILTCEYSLNKRNISLGQIGAPGGRTTHHNI